MDIIEDRQPRYGDASAHFERTVDILRIVFGETRISDLAPEDWAIVMVCDKLARFAHTGRDADSIDDVAGYARLWRDVRETRRVDAAARIACWCDTVTPPRR